MAAVVAQEGDLTEAQEEFLNQVIPLDEMADLYTPSVVNPIKFSEDFDDAFLESHKMEFLAVWLQLLPENVATYVKAWAAETQGYWEWGYRGPIGAATTLRGADPVSLVGVEWNPSLLSDGLAARFPLLFSTGSVVWLVVAAVFLCAMRKRSLSVPAALACFVPLLALLLTLFRRRADRGRLQIRSFSLPVDPVPRGGVGAFRRRRHGAVPCSRYRPAVAILQQMTCSRAFFMGYGGGRRQASGACRMIASSVDDDRVS